LVVNSREGRKHKHNKIASPFISRQKESEDKAERERAKNRVKGGERGRERG